LNGSGRFFDHSTVMFGSGAGPRLVSVCSMRKLPRVTSVRPSSAMPPTHSVAQYGSPENSASYSGVRRKRTMRSLITSWSISSCAPSSVSVPSLMSRSM
jgi:hypothetical protein